MPAPVLAYLPYVTRDQSVGDVDWSAGALLPVDKPQGWTSFDVVNKLRFLFRKITGVKRIKVGHAGTLDPMATGLLLIAVGKATKTLAQLTVTDKSYEGRIRLGSTTPTYDAESEVDGTYPLPILSDEILRATEGAFHGSQLQVPPIYSAIKKGGKPLYKYARAGQDVVVDGRPIVIHDLSLSAVAEDELSFICTCSKGTYIRSLAYDLGKHLNSGAHLIALRRTSVGGYKINDAWGMDALVTVLQDQIDKVR